LRHWRIRSRGPAPHRARTLRERGEDALVGEDLKAAAQNRVFGFELLSAPFVIAHGKSEISSPRSAHRSDLLNTTITIPLNKPTAWKGKRLDDELLQQTVRANRCGQLIDAGVGIGLAHIALLDRALDMEAIPVAPGIFFIFRDKILEQRFLLDRQRRIQFPLATELRPPLDRQSLAERRLEALRPILERLWHRMLELGRSVVEEEVAPDLLLEIKNKIGSLRRAERLGGSPENMQRDTRRSFGLFWPKSI
jgi:hypothetical protein